MFISNNLNYLKFRRRKLRNFQTKAEQLLWTQLRRDRLGYKFRRQHSFGPFIMDFYCSKLRLSIEADGPIHDEQKQYDKMRQKYLEKNSIRVLRFKNEEILCELEKVIEKGKSECETPTCPPPWQGEGRSKKETI